MKQKQHYAPIFKPDTVKVALQKREIQGKMPMLNSLFSNIDDSKLANQFSLFRQEKTVNPATIPHSKSKATIDTIREGIQKEMKMLDTQYNFIGKPSKLPCPSFLSKLIPSVFF